MNKCLGCGATLQSTNKNVLGYIKEDKLNNSNYCERCFKVIHYNEKVVTKLNNINKTIIDSLNKFNGTILFLIDFLNINQETIDTFNKINNKKYLVISKIDLLPKSFKETKISNYIKDTYKIKENIYFLSTKKNLNTKGIINKLIDNNENNICITGYTNAGKSTFINKILHNNDKEEQITTSSNPNTTVDFIKIDLPDITIYDSPGFTLENNIYDNDNFTLIKKINTKKMINPTTYQVKENNSIVIEDIIELESNIPNSITLYIPNEINIKREFNKISLQNKQNKTIKINNNQDIVIKGLGFINIKKECNIKIYSDYINNIEVRNSMF